jgi:hypothetical protein
LSASEDGSVEIDLSIPFPLAMGFFFFFVIVGGELGGAALVGVVRTVAAVFFAALFAFPEPELVRLDDDALD